MEWTFSAEVWLWKSDAPGISSRSRNHWPTKLRIAFPTVLDLAPYR